MSDPISDEVADIARRMRKYLRCTCCNGTGKVSLNDTQHKPCVLCAGTGSGEKQVEILNDFWVRGRHAFEELVSLLNDVAEQQAMTDDSWKAQLETIRKRGGL